MGVEPAWQRAGRDRPHVVVAKHVQTLCGLQARGGSGDVMYTTPEYNYVCVHMAKIFREFKT